MTSLLPAQAPPRPLREQVFLMAGSIHVAARATVITTVLGSCIAVCLWDPRRHVGGMNHFLLPKAGGERSGRYGDVAIDDLLQALERLGCTSRSLRAKLFGGATMLRGGPAGERPGAATVGEANLRLAVNRLRQDGIPVMAQRTGGDRGLLVRFDTATGEALVRRVAAVEGSAATPRGRSRPETSGG